MTRDPRTRSGDAGPTEARSAEQNEAILEERARELARPLEEPRAGDALDALTFDLADGRYAIDTRWAIEVSGALEIVRLPGAPDCISGLFSWRGEILMAVDLRALFGGRPSGRGVRRVIVIGAERPELGLIVDSPPELEPLLAQDIHPAATLLPEGARDLVLGITHDARLFLDAGALLGDGRLVLDQVPPTEGGPLDHEGTS